MMDSPILRHLSVGDPWSCRISSVVGDRSCQYVNLKLFVRLGTWLHTCSHVDLEDCTRNVCRNSFSMWRCQPESLSHAAVLQLCSSRQEWLTGVWIKIDQLDVTCFIISLFNAQHVSNVSTSILRSLRLICWVTSWVVLLWFDVCWCYVVVWLGWCGIRMQAEAYQTTPAKLVYLFKYEDDARSNKHKHKVNW